MTDEPKPSVPETQDTNMEVVGQSDEDDHMEEEGSPPVPTSLIMNCLFWNAQEAGSKGFQRACRYIIKHNHIDILALLETHVFGTPVNEVCLGFQFNHCVRVEAVGFSGGIWMLWNDSRFKLQVIAIHDNFIHSCIQIREDFLHLIIIYAPPTTSRREAVSAEIGDIQEPLFIGGDFNCILSLEEHQGGTGGLSADFDQFLEWVNMLELIDMGFFGPRFTWRMEIETQNRACKRLDRVFVNLLGRLRWEESLVKHLPVILSDHNPILLSLVPDETRERKPFRFEATWILHPNFLAFVKDSWLSDSEACVALQLLKVDLLKWNRQIGNLGKNLTLPWSRRKLSGFKKVERNGYCNTRFFHLSEGGATKYVLLELMRRIGCQTPWSLSNRLLIFSQTCICCWMGIDFLFCSTIDEADRTLLEELPPLLRSSLP
ncbi:hypothetical protein V2J09_006655 [Rumex salicifolius]